jgi:hypothetical protein
MKTERIKIEIGPLWQGAKELYLTSASVFRKLKPVRHWEFGIRQASQRDSGVMK